MPSTLLIFPCTCPVHYSYSPAHAQYITHISLHMPSTLLIFPCTCSVHYSYSPAHAQYITHIPLHMPSTLLIFPCTCPVHSNTTLHPLDGHVSKMKKINNGPLICNSAKKCHFHAITAVSRCSSAEEGCTDTNGYRKTL